jgi:hypothetical protein
MRYKPEILYRLFKNNLRMIDIRRRRRWDHIKKRNG